MDKRAMELKRHERNSVIFEEVMPLNRKSMVVRPSPPPQINHRKHSCTDVHCLVIFACFIVAWFYVAHYAWSTGDLDKVLIPTDSKNRKCGVDLEVRNKPYLFFYDLDKCFNVMTPLNGCKTKQVCVEKCPEQPFVWNDDLSDDLPKIKELIICDDDIDKTTLKSPDEALQLIREGRCSGWHLKSHPVFNHCVPFSGVDFCHLIPDSLKSRRKRRNSLFERTQSNYETLPQAMPSTFFSDIKSSLKNRTASLCSKNQTTSLVLQAQAEQSSNGLTKIIAAILSKFTDDSLKMAEYINADLKISWKIILVAFVMHIVAVLIYITLLRWIAKPIVWLSICGVIIGLAMVFIHSFKQYRFWRENPHVSNHGANLEAQFQNVVQSYRFWLYLSVVTGAALVIIFLIVVFIRKRISIAIAIVKEASRAITSIKTSIFFPIFPGFLYIFVTGLGLLVVLYLSSIGELSFRLFKQLDIKAIGPHEICKCTGPAAYYKLQDKCDPEVFRAHCHIEHTNKPCLETVCRFVEIEKTKTTQMYMFFSVFAYVWVTFFISAYGEMVLACTFSMWYWTFDKKNVATTPILKAMGITTFYHLGTLAFGALVLSICRMIRYVLDAIEKKVKLYQNALTKAIICCMKCFFWLLENFLRFLNRNAYITCAIHSTSFCASSRKAFALITQNILRMYAVDKVSDFLFFLSKLLLTGCTSFATYIFLIMYPNVVKVYYPLVPVILVVCLAYVMADVIFNTYAMAVDTIFFCCLEDYNENDGSPEKPYYMSKELCKIFGKKKAIQKSKQIRNDIIRQ